MTKMEALTLRSGHHIRLREPPWLPSVVEDRCIFIDAEVTGHITRPIICTEADLHPPRTRLSVCRTMYRGNGALTTMALRHALAALFALLHCHPSYQLNSAGGTHHGGQQ